MSARTADPKKAEKQPPFQEPNQAPPGYLTGGIFDATGGKMLP